MDILFDLDLPAGSYSVKVTALGVENISQLGVGEAVGAPPDLTAIDLNNDGVDEYRMENDSVQVTLLATGARVIEYFVKSRNDNVLFKFGRKNLLMISGNSGKDTIILMAVLKISSDREVWRPIRYIRLKL